MPLTKTQVFAELDANIGNSLDLRGNTLNTMLKAFYESLEQLTIDEATARGAADIVLSDAITDEATARGAADILLSDAIEALELIITDNVSRLVAAEALITALTADYTLAGVALPTTDPGTPTVQRAYLASENGTYTHFKNDENVAYTLSNELVLFLMRPGNFTIKRTLINL